MWFVYILECQGTHLYTGITNDVAKRLQTHRSGKGAKFTRGRQPLELLAVWEYATKSEALKREIAIKKMSKKNEQIVTGDMNTGDRNTGDRNTGDRNTGNGNATDNCCGFLCSSKQPTIIFDKKVSDEESVKYWLIDELSEKMMSDSPIENIERYLTIPNATKKKILSLHALHISRRAEIKAKQ